MSSERRVIILGSTGSIGTQSLEVIASLNALADRDASLPRYRVVGLAAGSRDLQLAEQARAWGVGDVALVAPPDGQAKALLAGARIRTGEAGTGAEQLIREVPCDIVVAAIDGGAGIRATLAAAELGRHIALANKESLVAAGELITSTCQRTGATLLPVDSEHSAIWQALIGLRQAPTASLTPPLALAAEVTKVWLTASGGPFRTLSLAEIQNAPRERALKHPTWNMGEKVTLDSATLTNKAFEMIEAHWLFGLSSDRLGVLIHPQSVVHSVVELSSGAQLAQLGSPDMRVPIQFALTHPSHRSGPARGLDWSATSRLDFTIADEERFEAIALARRVISRGGTSGAIFNAASEQLSRLYRAGAPAGSHGHVAFGQLVSIAARAVDTLPITEARTLEQIEAASAAATEFVRHVVGVAPNPPIRGHARSSHA